MDAKIHHIAFTTAREYAKDGYHLVDYQFNDTDMTSNYNLVHDNGNLITVTSLESENVVIVKKNGKINKTIQL